jgi:hypothetical protein
MRVFHSEERYETMTNFKLPPRAGSEPKTGLVPPQLQFSDTSPPKIYEQMASWFFSAFPHSREEPTRISVPTSRALWLDEEVRASADSLMPPRGSREFAHLHADGSFHLVLGEDDQGEVLARGWGLLHPWKDRGVNEIMLFAPRNEEEIDQLKPVIAAAYAHAMRHHTQETGVQS